jgi:hypothetical protein
MFPMFWPGVATMGFLADAGISPKTVTFLAAQFSVRVLRPDGTAVKRCLSYFACGLHST